MSASCCDHNHTHTSGPGQEGYRRALWAVLIINAAMFVVEVAAGYTALAANAATFAILWAYRTGDANMRSACLAPASADQT